MDAAEALPTAAESYCNQPPIYNGNRGSRRKRDMESSLINFMNTPIPYPAVNPPPESNPDRSFFESLLPALSGFTEDQKLDFRCEVLNIVKRMRQNTRHTHIPSFQAHQFPQTFIPPSAYSASAIPVSQRQPVSNIAYPPPQNSSYSSVHPINQIQRPSYNYYPHPPELQLTYKRLPATVTSHTVLTGTPPPTPSSNSASNPISPSTPTDTSLNPDDDDDTLDFLNLGSQE